MFFIIIELNIHRLQPACGLHASLVSTVVSFTGAAWIPEIALPSDERAEHTNNNRKLLDN